MVTCPASFTLAGRFPTTIIVIVKREREDEVIYDFCHAPPSCTALQHFQLYKGLMSQPL